VSTFPEYLPEIQLPAGAAAGGLVIAEGGAARAGRIGMNHRGTNQGKGEGNKQESFLHERQFDAF
jgi:hypothetical protein